MAELVGDIVADVRVLIPSKGLRRRIKAPVRKGASSNLVDIIMFSFFLHAWLNIRY